MKNSIIYMLRKYWYLIIIALIVSAPLTYLGAYRTDQALILKGGTTDFLDVVSIDTDYEISGKFSTLYVVTMEKSTKLQNLITNNDPTIERYTMNTGSIAISDSDSWKASKIQYESSIYNALIVAYTEANKVDSNIKLDYKFLGFDVTYYGENSRFKIGDRIIKISPKIYDYKEIDLNDELLFRNAINHKYVGDKYTVERNKEIIEIELTKNDSFSSYSIYNINSESSKPSFKINDSNVGGPSGGLLQTLSIYDRLTGKDLTKGLSIAGTGTIAYDGTVGAIGGIKEKIPTAIDNHVDVFFCPKVNYDDALLAYNSLPNSKKMKLVMIETFYDALNYLKEMK